MKTTPWPTKTFVLDSNAFTDERVGRYLAPRSDKDVFLDFYKCANARLFAHSATIEIDELGVVNLHIATEDDVVGYWHWDSLI